MTDKIKGEGETILVRKTKVRVGCDFCGNDATKKHTFLLSNARSNPASSGYGGDDISWCQDEAKFVCDEHEIEGRVLDGYRWCSTYSLGDRFAHIFLEWQEEEIKEELTAA